MVDETKGPFHRISASEATGALLDAAFFRRLVLLELEPHVTAFSAFAAYSKRLKSKSDLSRLTYTILYTTLRSYVINIYVHPLFKHELTERADFASTGPQACQLKRAPSFK